MISDARNLVDTTTDHEVYYTLGFKVNNSRITRSHDRSNPHSINRLKNQIKFVLNFDLHTRNETIDKYIVESFNVYNPDPVYVFVLPDESNRTITFRRSNFSSVSFPNTTSLQVLHKLLKSSKLAHLFPSYDQYAPKQAAQDDRRFLAKYKQFMSSEDDLHEAESLKIIEENVRTEKNFFKFMDQLNDDIANDAISIEASAERTVLDSTHKPTDYSALIRNIHANDHIGNYKLQQSDSSSFPHKLANDRKQEKVAWPSDDESVSWDDFGLHGWVGNINTHHANPQENG